MVTSEHGSAFISPAQHGGGGRGKLRLWGPQDAAPLLGQCLWHPAPRRMAVQGTRAPQHWFWTVQAVRGCLAGLCLLQGCDSLPCPICAVWTPGFTLEPRHCLLGLCSQSLGLCPMGFAALGVAPSVPGNLEPRARLSCGCPRLLLGPPMHRSDGRCLSPSRVPAGPGPHAVE